MGVSNGPGVIRVEWIRFVSNMLQSSAVRPSTTLDDVSDRGFDLWEISACAEDVDVDVGDGSLVAGGGGGSIK